MTPDDRALALRANLAKTYISRSGGDDWVETWVNVVATAIRVAENEALERAARLVVSKLRSEGANSACMVTTQVARAVRSLKHPEDKR